MSERSRETDFAASLGQREAFARIHREYAAKTPPKMSSKRLENARE
jgi:hypothetical protein